MIVVEMNRQTDRWIDTLIDRQIYEQMDKGDLINDVEMIDQFESSHFTLQLFIYLYLLSILQKVNFCYKMGDEGRRFTFNRPSV